ncbi:MAG: RNA methyltransferase PUA domain-containing protein, partial [Byssovorax sp.]
MGPQAAPNPGAQRAPLVSMGPQAAPNPGALRAPLVSMGPQAAPNPGAQRAPLRVPFPLTEAGLFPLPTEAATYVTRVHRLEVGDAFLAFDPERAVEADAELTEVSKRGATARIGAIRPALLRSTRAVTLIQ